MKAVLLAAGLGTRLRPLTETVPKCMVPLGGKPLLEWWILQLLDIGVKEILINTFYLKEQVDDFINASPYQTYVKLVHEPELLGTLGTIRNLQPYLDNQATFIAHADNFCITDFNAFVDAYHSRPAGCDMTMMLFETDNPSGCGMVETGENGRIVSYVEKPQSFTGGNLANAAVFIASPDAIARMCQGEFGGNEICRDFVPCEIGRINTFFNPDVMIDVGTLESYTKAQSVADKVCSSVPEFSECKSTKSSDSMGIAS